MNWTIDDKTKSATSQCGRYRIDSAVIEARKVRVYNLIHVPNHRWMTQGEGEEGRKQVMKFAQDHADRIAKSIPAVHEDLRTKIGETLKGVSQ